VGLHILSAGGLQHFSRLVATVFKELLLVITVLRVNLQHRDSPGIHALAVDLDVVFFARQAFSPQAQSHMPLALPDRLLIGRPEPRSAKVELWRTAALVP